MGRCGFWGKTRPAKDRSENYFPIWLAKSCFCDGAPSLDP
jgi:hypothetical protein